MITAPILTSDFTVAKIPRTVNEVFLKLSARMDARDKTIDMLIKENSSLRREVTDLKQDMVRLKANSGVRCKKAVIESLKSKHEPTYTYHEWIKTIVVEEIHLKEVFANNLTEGIIMCVFGRISQDGVSMIPIRSFVQKPSNIYIFSSISENTSGWVIASPEDLEVLISDISRKIMVKFEEWNRKNAAVVEDSERERNNDMNRMMKMFDISITRKKRGVDLKKHFIERFAQDITSP